MSGRRAVPARLVGASVVCLRRRLVELGADGAQPWVWREGNRGRRLSLFCGGSSFRRSPWWGTRTPCSILRHQDPCLLSEDEYPRLSAPRSVIGVPKAVLLPPPTPHPLAPFSPAHPSQPTQVLNTLPRRDHKFVEVSSNWRDYSVLTCNSSSDAGSDDCTFVSTGTISSDLSKDKLNFWLAPYLVVRTATTRSL